MLPPRYLSPGSGAGWTVAVANIVIALVSTLIMGWMTMFQSLKEDIHSSEARLMEGVKLAEIRNDTRIHEVKMELKEAIADFKAENVSLRAEFKEDIADLREEIKGDLAELKEGVRAMGDKLDRVLETLLAAKI